MRHGIGPALFVIANHLARRQAAYLCMWREEPCTNDVVNTRALFGQRGFVELGRLLDPLIPHVLDQHAIECCLIFGHSAVLVTCFARLPAPPAAPKSWPAARAFRRGRRWRAGWSAPAPAALRPRRGRQPTRPGAPGCAT